MSEYVRIKLSGNIPPQILPLNVLKFFISRTALPYGQQNYIQNLRIEFMQAGSYINRLYGGIGTVSYFVFASILS